MTASDVDEVIEVAEKVEEKRAAEDIPRDRWDRPLITPLGKPAGTKKVGYTRASTLGGALEDTFGLTAWKLRMVAIGVATRPEIVLAVNAAAKGDRDSYSNKKKLNDFAEKAMEAAQASAKAHVGTALHAYAEQVDLGNDPGYIPEEYAADLQAYIDITAGLLRHDYVEQFCVCDEIQTGGTPDRVSAVLRPMRTPDGQIIEPGEGIIVDQKTSQNMDFGGIKFSVQLAVYAHSVAYDWQTSTRTPWALKVRQDWGLIIHTPSGTGTAALYWVDLTKGWELAQLAGVVREWRKHKGLVLPAADDCVVADDIELADDPEAHFENEGPRDWPEALAATKNLGELVTLAKECAAAGEWSDVMKRRFTKRKNALTPVMR